MKQKLNMLFCILLATFSACEGYDFNQEQYKKDVSLLSNSELVYDRQVAELQQGGDTMYVVASLSGSQASSEPYTVGLQVADSMLKAYNKSNFDIAKDRYAKLLPADCSEFPMQEMSIPAGGSKVMFPVYLKNLDKISPDSIYFLEYKIDSLKTPNYNPRKRHVLLRIYKKNFYATTQTVTNYTYTSSTIVIPSADGNSSEVRRPTNANRVFPIGENSVRLLAGDESFSDYTKALDVINTRSIILEMGDPLPENPLAKGLTIKPYKTLDVKQLTPIGEYDNTYLLNIIRTPDGRSTYYKEFRLHYKYRLQPTDRYREVNAKLRFQFNPRVDNL